jgi:hypothetical protein
MQIPTQQPRRKSDDQQESKSVDQQKSSELTGEEGRDYAFRILSLKFAGAIFCAKGLCWIASASHATDCLAARVADST